jgi:predicted AlkP superfamily pyrophosphatase or phosphodiesterase
MIRYSILLLLTIGSLTITHAQNPKLVVGIVIDQMKQEYLYRFEDKFGEGGFKRLQKDGFSCLNTHYNYIPTNTAPGHASIYTGTTPRYHGIISNDWYSKKLGYSVYCAGDSLAQGVGGKGIEGNRSAVNLRTTTITDELKLTTNFRAKVVGISLKDRGAILPAGHHPDGAYWFDKGTGNFMTSDYYTSSLPSWVENFNIKKVVDRYLNQVWKTELPISQYVESTADDTQYEVGFKGKDTPTFPYDLVELRLKNGPYGLIASTPYGNNFLAEFAKEAIINEQLGKDLITDFLAVSFSSTDYIGHNFAPNSIEIEDTYLKLDKVIADFITFLDTEIGKGQYTLFLTADHAVLANPQFLIDNQMPGGYVSENNIKTNLDNHLKGLYGSGEWVLNVSNTQIFLNQKLIQEKALNSALINEVVVRHLRDYDEIAEAYTLEDIKRASSSDKTGMLIQNGHNFQLSGDVAYVMKSGYLRREDGAKGTGHGSSYTYDTHVPLIFYGAGIKKGRCVTEISITDIAPTLSILMKTSLPSGCTGQPIEELFK